MVLADDHAAIANRFWIQQASSQPGALAVHPHARWQGYQMWTRRMVQLWTRVVELRSSPSIYGEVMGGRRWQWPLRALWRLVTLPVHRASHTLILRG